MSRRPDREFEQSWSRWLIVTVPLTALMGLIYGLLTEFGPLGNEDKEGWRSVRDAGIFFGAFMLVWLAIGRAVVRRRRQSGGQHGGAEEP